MPYESSDTSPDVHHEPFAQRCFNVAATSETLDNFKTTVGKWPIFNLVYLDVDIFRCIRDLVSLQPTVLEP